MRKLKSWFVLSLMAIVALSLGACSDEDEPIAPVYPEVQELVLSEDNTVELKFTANTSWILSSGAIWCKMVDGDFESPSQSGQAGDITVKVKLAEPNPAFKDESTELRLRLGDDTNGQVIAKVTRPANIRKVEVLKVEYTSYGTNKDTIYTPVDHFEMIYRDRKAATYMVKANFNFVGKFTDEESEKLEIYIPKKGSFTGEKVNTLTAEANQTVTFTLNVLQQSDHEKYPVSLEDNKVMQFVDADDQVSTITVPYTFDGMPAEEMISDFIDDDVIDNPRGWTVDMEGTMFSMGGGLMGGGPQPVDSHIDTKITTLRDDFQLYVFVDMGEGTPIVNRYQDTHNEWGVRAALKEGSKDEVVISATKGNGPMQYYVVALPAVIANEYGELDASKIAEIISDGYGPYIVMEVKQKDADKVGVDICNNMMMEFTPAEDMTGDFDMVSSIQAFIPDVTEETPIFSTGITLASPFSLSAQIPGWNIGYLEVYDQSGKQVAAEMVGMGEVPGTGNQYITLEGIPSGMSFIRFIGEDPMTWQEKTLAVLTIWAE